jgi:hypothetical protein
MKNKKIKGEITMKRSQISILTIMLTVTLFTVKNLHPTWVLNGTPPPTDSDDNKATQSITNGAANFLQSYANILILLNESELSEQVGFNFTTARTAVNKALKSLISSREQYMQTFLEMRQVNFESSAIQKLKEFDYNNLVENRQLNPCVMNRVSWFLGKGDLVGLFEKVVKDLDDTIINLSVVRSCLQQDIIPDLEDLRRLYQQYSDFMTFGYYCSLVFSEIKK